MPRLSKADYALRAKCRRVLTLREQGKAAYKEASALLQEIVATKKAGDVIDMGHGDMAIVVDTFAQKNTVFGHAPVSRLELEVIKGVVRWEMP